MIYTYPGFRIRRNFKKRKNFSNEEKEFLIKNNITPENLTTRWEWVDLHPDLITEFYINVLYSINNRIPTSRELKKLGYSHFIEKLRKNGISLSELAKKCGFEPRSSHQRNISIEEALEFAQIKNIFEVIECSAKTGENVVCLFELITLQILKHKGFL